MALKKGDETKQTAVADQEALRIADAKALEEQKLKDAEAQKALEEQAAKDEEARLKKIEDDKAEEKRKADEQFETNEAARRELDRQQQAKDAESDRERIAQEEEAVRLAGKVPKERKLVEVQSLTFSDLRQPSTGTWISGKGTAFLMDDGWLHNQIASRLMQYIKED